MKFSRRNYIVLLCLIVLILCGCTNTYSASNDFTIHSSEQITLWVVTEQSVPDGMNGEAQSIIRTFSNEYPNVTVNLEILPTEAEKREHRLAELDELTKSGIGPDIYLMPTSNILISDQPQQYTYHHVTPLFGNVYSAIRDGYFMDLSSFYDADNSLEKDAFEETVIDAGVVDEARYVLPLRFLTPVLYSFDEKHDIPQEILSQNIDNWMEYIISTNDPLLACGAEYISYNAFSDFIDHNKGELKLSTKELRDYLASLYQIESLIGDQSGHRSSAQIESFIYGQLELYPLRIGPLSDAIAYAAIAEALNTQISMYPVRSTNGDYIATVSYYGAIGSTCNSPEAAYLFLKMFLSEDSQWELYRNTDHISQYPGLMEQSYPVRIKDSVEPLWQNLKNQPNSISSGQETYKLYQTIDHITITQSDLDILNTKIDLVRFPLPYEYSLKQYTSELVNQAQGYGGNSIDTDELAVRIVQILENYVIK